MHQASPASLIASTMACFVLVNVVVAQLFIRVAYPGSGLQLGTAVLSAVAVLAAISLVFVVLGWRTFIRRSRPSRRT